MKHTTMTYECKYVWYALKLHTRNIKIALAAVCSQPLRAKRCKNAVVVRHDEVEWSDRSPVAG